MRAPPAPSGTRDGRCWCHRQKESGPDGFTEHSRELNPNLKRRDIRDTKGARGLLESVSALTDLPVTTIINTHSDFDHVGGQPRVGARCSNRGAPELRGEHVGDAPSHWFRSADLWEVLAGSKVNGRPVLRPWLLSDSAHYPRWLEVTAPPVLPERIASLHEPKYVRDIGIRVAASLLRPALQGVPPNRSYLDQRWTHWPEKRLAFSGSQSKPLYSKCGA